MRSWLVVAVCTLLLVGITGPAGARDPYIIKVSETQFNPGEVIIQKGDAVRWEWESGTVVIVSGNPGDPTAGDLFSFPLNSEHPDTTLTFPETGKFPFFAQGNPENMSGTITVREASPVSEATWGKLKRLFESP